MCWFRKELEMPNSRVIQMHGSEGGGVGKVVKSQWGEGSWSLWCVQGGTDGGGVGCRDKLWFLVSVQNSGLHSHSCPPPL